MISRYFSMDEMLRSDLADRNGIDNTPLPEVAVNIVETCKQADKVREFLGEPMIVTSGYRCQKLNAAAKGSKTSSHIQGHAMDFICPRFGRPKDVFEALKKSDIKFDQLILEFPDSRTGGWVHIGFAPEMRHQKLVYDGQYRIA